MGNERLESEMAGIMDDEERSSKVMETYDEVIQSVALESAIDITMDLIGQLQERYEALKIDRHNATK